MGFHDDGEESYEPLQLELPKVFVLYRDQSADDVRTVIDAVFREVKSAQRYLNHYRALREHEFLTIEALDLESGVASVHSALTASTMRMVMTDGGPRAVPKEIAPLFDCECEEDSDE